MARRQRVFTAAQVGSLMDDDEQCLFSGSDDDFDVSLDQELDPLEREQGKVIKILHKCAIKIRNLACKEI